MKFFLTIILAICIGIPKSSAAGNAFVEGNNAYRAADYHKAVRLYNEVLKDGPSAEVYYNLGNAYYRVGSIAKAILCYEKAAKIQPMNADIQHNLEIAQAKTIDRMTFGADVFIIQWYHNVQALATVDVWAYVSVGTLITALLSFLMYLFMERVCVRRLSFYLSMALLLLSLTCNLFALQRSHILKMRTEAIVMRGVVTIKTSPTAKAGNIGQIHEGTKVKITDNDINGWYGVSLSDGREGWIQRKDVEEI